MRKIRYNIAENKRIDYLKFGIVSAFVLVISFVFIMLGISNLWSSDKRAQDQEAALKKAEREIEKLTRETDHLKTDVTTKKSLWRQRVSFANSLIRDKKFSVIDQLDILEKHLPEGVFFTDFSMNIETSSNIQVGIAADSLHRLTEAYDAFARFRKTVKNELEEEGLFKASLILNMNPGKAEEPKAQPIPGRRKKADDDEELRNVLK